MILRLICPSGHVLDVDAQLAGRKVRCGACGRIMLVPAAPVSNRPAAAKPPRKPLPRTAPKSPPEKPSIERPAAEEPLAAILLSESPPESPAAAGLPRVETPLAAAPAAPPPEVPLATVPDAAFPPVPLERSIPAELLAAAPSAELPTITYFRKPVESELPAISPFSPPSEAEAMGPTVALPPAVLAAVATKAPTAPLPADISAEDQPEAEPPPLDEGELEPELPALAAERKIDEAVTLPRSRSAEFLCWLRNQLPSHPAYLPDGAIEPSWSERRTARQLAAVLAAVAVLSLLPAVLSGHANLLAAPPWALWAAVLAAVQLVYALWLANAPDWSTLRVQMIVSAALTTIYAMALTLVLITPSNRTLILGLDEVRWPAPAWCALMVLVLGGVTWYCGRTSARWRAQLAADRP